MAARRRMRNRYRRLAALTDVGGIKSAIGEAKGFFFPKQPRLNKEYAPLPDDGLPDEEWFRKTIREKVAIHPDNAMEYPHYGEKMFDEPLVGFVRGDDPLLADYKKIIGPHHFTPHEIMKWQAEKNRVPSPKAEDLTVVSFILPLTRRTKDDNKSSKEWVSERWAQTRLLGEIFSQTLVREIVTDLMGRGILAVSPDVTPFSNKKRYPGVGWASPWSHRHMAYAAGLGTFGIHDFLITEKGAAHRCGSFVVALKLQPDRIRPHDIHAHCLHYQGFDCLACKRRCPAGAIDGESGHDKEACMKRVAASTKRNLKNYHIFIYGCGLCATGVPCESAIPARLLKKAGA
jgi:epoxyqueuosine reductase